MDLPRDASEAVGPLESAKGKETTMHYLGKELDFEGLEKYIAYLSPYQNDTIKLLWVKLAVLQDPSPD